MDWSPRPRGVDRRIYENKDGSIAPVLVAQHPFSAQIIVLRRSKGSVLVGVRGRVVVVALSVFMLLRFFLEDGWRAQAAFGR